MIGANNHDNSNIKPSSVVWSYFVWITSKNWGKIISHHSRSERYLNEEERKLTPSGNMRRNRSSFSFPDFSLRRLLLQGARAARGSPTLGNRCDIEKGTSSSSKGEKSSSSSNKVSCIDFSLPVHILPQWKVLISYLNLRSGGRPLKHQQRPSTSK